MKNEKNTYFVQASCGNCGWDNYHGGINVEKGKTLNDKKCPNCGCKTLRHKPTL